MLGLQHAAFQIAVEHDQIEFFQAFDEQFVRGKSDQRQFVERREIVLIRRAQNGEMNQVDRRVGFQQIAPRPFRRVGLAGNEQHAQAVAHAVDADQGTVVDGGKLALGLFDEQFGK
nr:hypothetical protein [uncultured Brevundimonas sp.]